MHNEMLQVEGRKMSKSLGNFFTVRDLLDQGKDGTVLRLVLLRTHYSSPIDFSSAAYSEMEEKLHKWFRSINALVGAPRHLRNWVAPDRLMMDCFADDLNTWGAIVRLDQLEKLARRGDTNAAMTLDASLAWLGIEEHVTFDQREMGIFSRASLRRGTPEVSLAIDGLIAKRADARRMKQYAESDRIRDGLEAAGIRVVDGVDGPEWEVLPDFDPSKLMGLE
jgi:cysteinyl-tRNA synthetase